MLGAVLVAGSLLGSPVSASAEEPAAGDTVVGELVQAWPEYEEAADAAAHADEGPLSWIETGSGDAVRVPTEDIAAASDAEVGDTVSVTLGAEVVDEAADAGLDPARDVLGASVVAAAPADPAPAVAAAGTVTDQVTVVMVVPAGTSADERALGDVVDAVNGPAAAFWSDQSDGAIRMGVTASVDARATKLTAPCANPYGIWTEAAQRAGWTAGPGKHLLVYLPKTATDCSYGLAEIGSSLTAGGRLYVRDVATSVIAHELGHNFGLGHSSELQCDGAVETRSCQVSGYNDWYDVMGYSWDQVGTLNAPQAARLGFLPAAEQATMTAGAGTTTWTLVPVSSATGTRAVRLVDAAGTAYWLEYRQASGRDAWLGSSALNWPGVQSGVTVRRGAGQPDTSLLLDPTPSASAQWSSDRRTALPVGTAVPLAGGAFTVTVQSVSAGGAVLQVATRATPISIAYDATGGPAGPLGGALTAETCGLRDGGCYQAYRYGLIYWSTDSGAHVVAGDVGGGWLTRGAQDALGYPTGEVLCGLRDGGCLQDFQGGRVYWTAATGTAVSRGAVQAGWERTGAQDGPLGYPLGDVACRLVAAGCAQPFQGGWVFWSPGTGAHVVAGTIGGGWFARGAQNSTLGYPVAEMVCGLRDGGCLQDFQGGRVYWSPGSPVAYTRGSVQAAWEGTGTQDGPLGYPVGDMTCGLRDSGCAQPFQAGWLFWSPTTGARVVAGDVGAGWFARGAQNGVLGYPVGAQVCGLRDGGCLQQFQGGRVYWSPATGAHWVRGLVIAAYEGLSAQDGTLGFPTTDEVCGLRGGGCFNHFQGGSVYWSPATGAHAVTGAIRDVWALLGWESGWVGYPLGDAQPVPGGVQQRFEGGTLLWTASTGQVTRV